LEDWRTKAIGLFPGLPEGAEALSGPISGSPAQWGELYRPFVNPYDEKPVNDERIGRSTILKQPQTDSMEAHVSDAIATGIIDNLPLDERVFDDLHRWVFVETFQECESLFRLALSKPEHRKFSATFLTRKRLFSGQSRL